MATQGAPVNTKVADVIEEKKNEVSLLDIKIETENMALNVMVGFLNVAQRRGSFTIEEAAKIAECINRFKRDAGQQAQAPAQAQVQQ